MRYSVTMKNLRKQASETMENVTTASQRVVVASEWAAVALIGVAAVSILALTIAVIALGRTDER